jgi:hypothetical protein
VRRVDFWLRGLQPERCEARRDECKGLFISYLTISASATKARTSLP